MPQVTKTVFRRQGYGWRWRILNEIGIELARGQACRWREARRAAKDFRKKMLTRPITGCPLATTEREPSG